MRARTRVEKVAVVWWLSKRPINWTTEQHRAVPCINCVSDVERALAESVVEMLSSKRPRRARHSND